MIVWRGFDESARQRRDRSLRSASPSLCPHTIIAGSPTLFLTVPSIGTTSSTSSASSASPNCAKSSATGMPLIVRRMVSSKFHSQAFRTLACFEVMVIPLNPAACLFNDRDGTDSFLGVVERKR